MLNKDYNLKCSLNYPLLLIVIVAQLRRNFLKPTVLWSQKFRNTTLIHFYCCYLINKNN